MSHHIIEATDLSFVYPDGTAALSHIAFRITHGESVAIVGANGAGKSTLLLHFTGCLLPSNGALVIGDTPVKKSTLAAIRRHVGMVFQNPDDQLFMPTILDDVMFGALNLGLDEDTARARAEHALSTVGASHLAPRPPYRLSWGEKRLCAIAAVLAMEPDILVLDEPSSGLDPQARRRLIALLKTFMHSKIIATHDLDMAYEICERTIVFHHGEIVADGDTKTLLSDANLLQSAGLELPLTLTASH